MKTYLFGVGWKRKFSLNPKYQYDDNCHMISLLLE